MTQDLTNLNNDVNANLSDCTSINGRRIRCSDVGSLAVLRGCDELDSVTVAALEAHTAQCPACAAVVSREDRLHQVIMTFEQPADSMDRSSLLLAQCRSQLAEAIDDRQAASNQASWRAILSPAAWWSVLRGTLVYHPAMSMAALVIISFSAGVVGQRIRFSPPATSPQPVMTVSASPKVTDEQLHSAASANVEWVTPSDSRTPTVQVQIMSQTPTNIVGAPDDTEVEHALAFVLENSQQFDPGARLNALDVLGTRASDPEVRRVLCASCRTDRNPGVRMKALESLQGYEQDPAVRQTLLDALRNDTNSGVRIEAINLLVNSLRDESGSGSTDVQTVSVLRDRLRNDPNNYVRLQSANALRELGK